MDTFRPLVLCFRGVLSDIAVRCLCSNKKENFRVLVRADSWEEKRTNLLSDKEERGEGPIRLNKWTAY